MVLTSHVTKGKQYTEFVETQASQTAYHDPYSKSSISVIQTQEVEHQACQTSVPRIPVPQGTLAK